MVAMKESNDSNAVFISREGTNQLWSVLVEGLSESGGAGLSEAAAILHSLKTAIPGAKDPADSLFMCFADVAIREAVLRASGAIAGRDDEAREIVLHVHFTD